MQYSGERSGKFFCRHDYGKHITCIYNDGVVRIFGDNGYDLLLEIVYPADKLSEKRIDNMLLLK
jgi:hypothetical protein